ncbi:hypothetical protein BG74_02745 [Sodalis-like endosymbiont of Proechinophthirus fluctus]|nr:hypothetical protein BG74_02745 [Sodalis-like endosymbiont of Proechinophthirus fluctus]
MFIWSLYVVYLDPYKLERSISVMTDATLPGVTRQEGRGATAQCATDILPDVRAYDKSYGRTNRGNIRMSAAVSLRRAWLIVISILFSAATTAVSLSSGCRTSAIEGSLAIGK